MGGSTPRHLIAGMTAITVALLTTAALASSALITLIALVSVASPSEDAKWTLSSPAPGLIQAIARRVLGFYAERELASPRAVPALGGCLRDAGHRPDSLARDM